MGVRIFWFALLFLGVSVNVVTSCTPGQSLFLGDFAIRGWTTMAPGEWEALYVDGYNSINFGQNNYTTTDVIKSLPDLINTYQPYLFTIMIGSNDLAKGANVQTVAANIQRIVEIIKFRSRLGVKIILHGILPRGQRDIHAKIIEVNDIIMNLGDNKTVHYLDMESIFADGVGMVKPLLYGLDQVHLSTFGYIAWQEMAGWWGLYDILEGILHKYSSEFPGRLLFLGDFYLDEWRPNQQDFFLEYDPRNLAVASYTTDDLINRIENEGILDGLNPKYVALLIGTNDIIQGKTPDYVVNNIWQILTLLEAKFQHAELCVHGLPPVVGRASLLTQLQQVNDALVRDYDIKICKDWFKYFTKDGVIQEAYFQPDGIHLSEEGYNVFNNVHGSVAENANFKCF